MSYQKFDTSIDAHLLKEQSCQISPRPDLKRRSLRLFWTLKTIHQLPASNSSACDITDSMFALQFTSLLILLFSSCCSCLGDLFKKPKAPSTKFGNIVLLVNRLGLHRLLYRLLYRRMKWQTTLITENRSLNHSTVCRPNINAVCFTERQVFRFWWPFSVVGRCGNRVGTLSSSLPQSNNPRFKILKKHLLFF